MFLLLTIIVALFFPVYHLFTHKKLNELVKSNPKYKLIDYKKTILFLWVLALLILVVFFVQQEDLSLLGLSINFDINFTISLVVGSALVIFLLVSSKVTPENIESIEKKFNDIIFYLPINNKEFKWFVLVSLSAGLCEELIYRGYLYWYLNQYTNIYVSLLISNILFALAHLWSGGKNIIASFFTGLVMAGVYLFSGSIWVSILIHAGIDIQSGLITYRLNLLKESNN